MKDIGQQYVDEFQRIQQSLSDIFKMINQMIQVYKEQIEKLAKDATKEIREEIKQSKEKVERQAKKLKKELSKLKKVIEAPSAALGTVCGGVKSAISFVKDSGKKVGNWFSNLFGKRRKKRNACGIPAIVPNVDINVPGIDLDAMKNFLKKNLLCTFT